MYNMKTIENLEKIFDEVENLETPLTYENASLLLERKRVTQYLDKLFKNKESIYEEDIYSLTKKRSLRNVIKLYLIRNDKPIIKEQIVSISDLSNSLKMYKDDISKNETISDEAIEKLLEDRTLDNVNCVMNSLLDFVFDFVLPNATDEFIFEDLLSQSNAIFVTSIYKYDKNIHHNFKEFLKYNLEVLLSNNERYTIYDESPKSQVMFANKYEEKIVDRIDNIRLVKGIIDSANLSTLERKIIEYIYGLSDGMPHTYEEAALEFKMNTNGATQVGINALVKLKRVRKID